MTDANVANVVGALAKADFSEIAARFISAGFRVELPAEGILQIRAAMSEPKRLRLLLSVGVHGDETAPIEMLAHLLNDLSGQPQELAVDLMVVVGNLAAIVQGQRFLDADLNRMFTDQRGALQSTAEARRADVIMRATDAFFSADGAETAAQLPPRWHLDLHTAIRKSHYPTFAVVPDVIPVRDRHALTVWLGGAGIGAVILNSQLAPTYSAYTATRYGVAACTAELGQIGVLGENDLSQFAVTAAAIDAMLRSGATLAFRRTLPHVFEVAQEIVKRSEDFRMSFDRATQNFTPLESGAMIARDGVGVYVVGPATEYVVFPNPDVRVGQRAGLMVVRRA